MNMGIDQAGQNCGIAEILDLCVPWHLIRSDHAPDSFSFHQHSGRTHSLRCDYPTGEEGAQAHCEVVQKKSLENETRA